jgi:hypothetical protein
MKQWSIFAAILMLCAVLFMPVVSASQVNSAEPLIKGGICADFACITTKSTYQPVEQGKYQAPPNLMQVEQNAEQARAENLTLRNALAAVMVGMFGLVLWITLERLRQPILKAFKDAHDDYE